MDGGSGLGRVAALCDDGSEALEWQASRFSLVMTVIQGQPAGLNPESRESGFDAIEPRFARTRWHRPGMTVSEFLLRSRSSPRRALARRLALRVIGQLAQAIAAQAILIGERHRKAGGFLGAPAGARQAAAEFGAAAGADDSAGRVSF